MKEHFPNLAFEVQGNGFVVLEQWQNQERVAIDVHPQQLAHIGRALFNGKNPAAERIEELERRLAVLSEKIQDFVMDDYNRGEIIERCGSGDVMLAQLDALRDLAWEFDGGLVPRYVVEADERVEQAQNRNSSEIGTGTEKGTAIPAARTTSKQPAGASPDFSLGSPK